MVQDLLQPFHGKRCSLSRTGLTEQEAEEKGGMTHPKQSSLFSMWEQTSGLIPNLSLQPSLCTQHVDPCLIMAEQTEVRQEEVVSN